MEPLHAAYTTTTLTQRRTVLRPVELKRSVSQLSPINSEWELDVDTATGAEYWQSNITHNTLAEPPLIEDTIPIPTLLKRAEQNKKRVQIGCRPDPTAGDDLLEQHYKQREQDLLQAKIRNGEAIPSNSMTWNFSKKIRPTRVDFAAIHRRFEPIKPPKRAFERKNLVHNGTRVMFYSHELKKPVLGVVDNGKVDPSNKTTMARRSNGVAFYRVKVIRMSKKNKTKISKKPPIYVSVEASDIEKPQAFKTRLLRNALNKLNIYTMAHGWGKWVSKCRKARHKDYKHVCARKIQKKFNVGKLKLAGIAESALILKYRKQRDAELERRRKIAEKLRKEAAYKEYTRRVGITPDGVNYFLTKREMQMFLYKRTQVMERCKQVLAPYWADANKELLENAIHQWKKVWQDETAHYHKAADEDWTLSHIPEIRSKIKSKLGYWHGAQDNNIPKNPPMTGVRTRKDGTIQILDLKRWQNFQESVMGPTDSCSWLLRPRILFGAYPDGPSRLDSTKLNARTPCVNSLAQAKIACYICLLTPKEEAARENFEHVISKLAKQQEVLLLNQVKSRRARVESIGRALNDARKAYDAYLKKKQQNPNEKTDITEEMLDSQVIELNKATKSLHFGEETLAAWPAEPEFIRMPLPAPTQTQSIVYDPTTLLNICTTIEDRLRKKQRIYIFSTDGHGRAGTVAACVFARLHGLTGHDALSRVQRTFDSRGDQLHRNKKRRRGKQLPRLSCPKHHVQRVSVLRFIDGYESEMFRDVSRSGALRDLDTGEESYGKGYETIYTRPAVRSQGVPFMEEPQRILKGGRMEQWWNHRERLLDKDLLGQVECIQKYRHKDLMVPEIPLAYSPSSFKNIWTPRTKLAQFPRRSVKAIVAQNRWKKAQSTVHGAVRIDLMGKKATQQRLNKEAKTKIAQDRQDKRKKEKKERKKKEKQKKKKEEKERKKKQKKEQEIEKERLEKEKEEKERLDM